MTPMHQSGEFQDSFPAPEEDDSLRFWHGLALASAINSVLWLMVVLWLTR